MRKLKEWIFMFYKGNLYKSFIVKIVAIFSSFSILLVVLPSTLILLLKNDQYEAELNNKAAAILKQVQIYMDTNIVDKLELKFYEDLMSSSSIISGFLANNTSDTLNLLQTYDYIKSVTTPSEFISSIYLYRQHDDVLLSYPYGFIRQATSPANKYLAYYNASILDVFIKSGIKRKWYSNEEIHTMLKNTGSEYLQGNNSTLSYAILLPYNSTPLKKEGCVIINLDEAALMKTLSEFYANTKARLVILDGNHHPVLSDLDHDALTFIAQHLRSEKNARANVEIGKIRYNLSRAKSGKNDWMYVLLVPDVYFKQQVLQTTYFAVIILMISTLLAFCGFYLISRQVFKPVRNLSDWIAGNLQEEYYKLPSGKTKNIFDSIQEKVYEVEYTLYVNRELIKNKIANDLLQNTVSSRDAIDKLSLVHVDFSGGRFFLIAFDLDKEFSSQLILEKREFVLYNAMCTINNTLKDHCEFISTSTSTNCIVYILCLPPSEASRERMDTISISLMHAMGYFYNLYVSREIHEINGIPEAYDAMKAALEYGYIHGYGNVLRQSEIELCEKSTDTVSMAELESALKKKNLGGIHDALTLIGERMKSGRYAIRNVYRCRNELFHAIFKYLYEYNKSMNEEKLLLSYLQMRSLDLSIEWLGNFVSQYGDQGVAGHEHEDIRADYLKNISEYIMQHVDDNLTLSSISEKFHISSGHLSRIFKKHYNVTFQDFIIMKKMEKAAQYLVDNAQMNIGEIAERLGYVNIPYFIKIFKTKYGVTPLQYRMKYGVPKDN